jgi:hypothetical protein
MFAVTLLSRPESLRRGPQLQRSRADASVDQVTRAQGAVSSIATVVVQAEFIMLASHLAPLGRHLPIQPSDIGIVSRFGFYLAFVGSDAELFRLGLRCHIRHPNNGGGVQE